MKRRTITTLLALAALAAHPLVAQAASWSS